MSVIVGADVALPGSPLALWLLVLLAVEEGPASATRIAVRVTLLSGGVHARGASTSVVLARLVAAGLLDVREMPAGGAPARVHRLTARGVGVLRRARAGARGLLR